jgi:hypothetical protein
MIKINESFNIDEISKFLAKLPPLKLKRIVKIINPEHNKELKNYEAAILFFADFIIQYAPLTNDDQAYIILEQFNDQLKTYFKEFFDTIKNKENKFIKICIFSIFDRKYCALSGCDYFLDLHKGEIHKKLDKIYVEVITYNLGAVVDNYLKKFNRTKTDN